MKHFAKSMVAVALLTGATAANASIAVNAGDFNEAFLSAFDSSTGKTFTYDLGLTYIELAAAVNNTSFSKSYDLASLAETSANWSAFLTGADLSKIVYSVTVGNPDGLAAAVTGPVLQPDLLTGSNFGTTAPSFIGNHAVDINAGDLDTSLNVSRMIVNLPEGSGEHGSASNLWNGWNHNPEASYGQAVAFQLGEFQVNFDPDGNFLGVQDKFSTFVGQWKLAGNSLTFAAPSAPSQVPLPAAVWMFGAGLMGVLRLNRRKSQIA